MIRQRTRQTETVNGGRGDRAPSQGNPALRTNDDAEAANKVPDHTGPKDTHRFQRSMGRRSRLNCPAALRARHGRAPEVELVAARPSEVRVTGLEVQHLQSGDAFRTATEQVCGIYLTHRRRKQFQPGRRVRWGSRPRRRRQSSDAGCVTPGHRRWPKKLSAPPLTAEYRRAAAYESTRCRRASRNPMQSPNRQPHPDQRPTAQRAPQRRPPPRRPPSAADHELVEACANRQVGLESRATGLDRDRPHRWSPRVAQLEP